MSRHINDLCPENGFVLINKEQGWGIRHWNPEKEPDAWTCEIDRDAIEFRPGVVYDKELKKVAPAPGVLDIEVTYDSWDSMGSCYEETLYREVPLEALAEVLRRSGYEVKKKD